MPELFGPYRLDALLGRGGMGEVYRAFHLEQDRTVALKLLLASLSVDAEYRERFLRESQMTAKLTEPHVIPVHSWGEIDGRLYIDMRFVDGGHLGARLRSGPLTPRSAVGIVAQVASALDAAHRMDLVHRDVKPSNVMLTARTDHDGSGDDFAYLVDFGIARSIRGSGQLPLTAIGHAVGTWAYMAPERFQDEPVDGRSDVYSLACVLHECLTGQRPFPGGEPSAVLAAHLMAERPRPSQSSGVPAAFDDVIARGMARDPDERYPTAGELAVAARAALASRAAEAPPATPQPPPTPPPTPPPPAPQAPPAAQPSPAPQPPPVAGPPTGARPSPAPPPVAGPRPEPATDPGARIPGRAGPPPGPAFGAAPPDRRPGPPERPARPDRGARRMWWAGGAGAAAAVIAVVAALLAWDPSATDRSTTPTRTSTPTPIPTAPRAPLSPADADLLAALPPGFSAENCAPAPDQRTTGVAAALRCGAGPADGPSSAVFLRYQEIAAMDEALLADARRRGLPADAGDCRAGDAVQTSWVKNGQPVGLLSCYPGPNAERTIRWTEHRALAMGVITRADGDSALLYDWWLRYDFG